MMYRDKLEELLSNKCLKIKRDRESQEIVMKCLKDRHNIPTGDTMDMLKLKTNYGELTDFTLYCLLEGFEQLDKAKYSTEYFSDKEISNYSSMGYERESVFPLRFKVNQGPDDQWIGFIDMELFRTLRVNQILNYNPNTQRPMKKVTRKGEEFFKPVLNTKSVDEIYASLKAGEYIPDTLTFNIPETAEFYYDNEQRELIITSIDKLDITDGYHRYMAFCRAMDTIPDFNYFIEVRITYFSEDKARHFIFQQDKKNHMPKVSAKAMDASNNANRVVKKLNTEMTSNLKGKIGQNEGLINLGEMCVAVEYFYFSKSNKEDIKLIIDTFNELRNKWNLITNANVSLLERQYTLRELIVITYIFSKYSDEGEIISKIGRVLDGSLENIKKKAYTNTGSLSKSYVDSLIELVEEV